jgi:hypothetical protein
LVYLQQWDMTHNYWGPVATDIPAVRSRINDGLIANNHPVALIAPRLLSATTQCDNYNVITAPPTPTSPPTEAPEGQEVGSRSQKFVFPANGSAWQSLVVPEWARTPCGTIEVKLWGASGGSGSYSTNNAWSGAGGFTRTMCYLQHGGADPAVHGWTLGGHTHTHTRAHICLPHSRRVFSFALRISSRAHCTTFFTIVHHLIEN